MNEHKNIITIEDEIKEFSDKPVKSSALYKKVKDLESGAVPDSSSANVGDVLTKGEDGIGWSAPSGGGSYYDETTVFDGSVTFENGNGDTGEPVPQSTNNLIVSIDGGENVTLAWDESYWHDEDNTIEAYEDNDTLWLYVNGISDGTHSAHITSNGLNSDFVEAVNKAYKSDKVTLYFDSSTIIGNSAYVYNDSELSVRPTADEMRAAYDIIDVNDYYNRAYHPLTIRSSGSIIQILMDINGTLTIIGLTNTK